MTNATGTKRRQRSELSTATVDIPFSSTTGRFPRPGMKHCLQQAKDGLTTSDRHYPRDNRLHIFGDWLRERNRSSIAMATRPPWSRTGMRADVPTTVATILKNYPSARHSADSHKRLTTKQGNYCAHAGLVHNVCVLPSRNQRSVTDSESTRQVDAVMAATRVLVGVVAQSIADVEDQVTLPQLRVLVMVATRGPLNLAAVAEGLGVHASNATRTVDRLVAAKLIDRRDAADDRRNVSITLTRSGQRLVDAVFEQRRSAIEAVLDRMPESKRRALPNALESFAAAAGEAPEQHPNAFQWNQ